MGKITEYWSGNPEFQDKFRFFLIIQLIVLLAFSAIALMAFGMSGGQFTLSQGAFMIFVVMCFSSFLGFFWIWFREKISGGLAGGIFMPSGSNTYEERLYQGDMIKAHNHVSYKRYDEAEKLYRHIVENVPHRSEPRVELAKVLQINNKLGQALREYQYIMDTFKPTLGDSHVAIREAEDGIRTVRSLLKEAKEKIET